jgi:flagellar biosynthesis protein FlhG
MNFACGADHVMVVTTPEPTAVTDGYAVIKCVCGDNYDGYVSLLVNMATGRQEARSTYQRIATVGRQFLGARVFDAGYILTDPKVPEAVKRRQPFVLAYPRCPASRCLAALATKLRSGKALVGGKEGFFRRVASWLG